METPKADPKDKFIHRELSWLAFNDRVLEEGADTANPLLERLRFLAIFVSNLDEFFMVRVAGLKKLLDSGYNHRDQFGFYPQELYAEILKEIANLNKKLYELYGKLKKELEKKDVHFKTVEELNNEQKRFVKKYFDSTLFPIITPMAVDPGHPFPILPSKTIAFAVNLSRYSKAHLAIIPIPQNVSRVLRVPSEGQEHAFILLDEIIKDNLKTFFKGYTIDSFTVFRILRDSEILLDEDLAPDLLKALQQELKKRARARVVVMEIEKACTKELLEILCQGIDFPQDQVTIFPGELDLSYLHQLVGQVDKPELRFPSYSPAKIPYENIFDKVGEGDFINHMPYQSFFPIVDLIQSAAKDPNVLAIKMTLYRTNEDSAIVQALKAAAKNKKQVTVLVEIRARFEEEKNINWVKELEDSGCHVIYGIAGLKIHSKMALIVRKHEGRILRYVHLSTGNYNENTARIYTDIGYFTVNDDFAKDISDVFNVITGFSVPSPWKRIISSPNDLRKYFFELIDKEKEAQKAHKNGMIWAKMNSLEDPQIIEKLYEASQAGVKIKLLVRGICCLLPGVPGLSENIEVRSIVGRFLEHSRIYIFNNNANARIFLASADWMARNFDRRIELLFEIYKEEIKDDVMKIMETYWQDNQKTRVLNSDRSYSRLKGDTKFNAQESFIQFYAK